MTKAMFKFLLPLLLALCASVQALAQDTASGNPPNFCRNGAFPGDGGDFRTARVVGAKGSRAYFHGDEEGCPGAKCRRTAYVIPGDELIVSRGFGDWLCAWYQPPKGSETVGWIPAHLLSVDEAAKRPPLARWLGAWKFNSQSLDIRRDTQAGRLRVEGEAFWKGFGDNIHTGALGGSARPEGNVLVVEDDICRATLRLVGDYLVVGDNSDCGGMNVRFDGVYRRRPTRRAPTRGRRSP
jgi:hypothetical protein